MFAALDVDASVVDNKLICGIDILTTLNRKHLPTVIKTKCTEIQTTKSNFSNGAVHVY